MFLVEFDHFHQLIGAVIGILQIRQKVPETVLVAQTPEHTAAQVLKNAELGKNVGDLEAARQPHAVDLEGLFTRDVLTVEQDLALAGLEAAADEIEQRRFAGAVGSDDADALTCRDRHVDAADDFGPTKGLAQVLQLQGVGHSSALRLISFSISS